MRCSDCGSDVSPSYFLGTAHSRGQELEDLVAGAGDRDLAAVLGRVMAVRHRVLHRRSHALANIAGPLVGRSQLVEDAEHRFVESDIDILSLAGQATGYGDSRRMVVCEG